MPGEIQVFGGDEHRAPDGTLLNGTVGRLTALIRGGGIVVAAGFGGAAAFVHPLSREDLDPAMTSSGFTPVLTFASMRQLEQTTQLGVAEVRVLEVLSPGALVLARADAESAPLIAIPASVEVRQMAEHLGGPLLAYTRLSAADETDVLASVRESIGAASRTRLIGLVHHPDGRLALSGSLTVARVAAPGQVHVLTEGDLSHNAVAEASNAVSQWEIEDWT